MRVYSPVTDYIRRSLISTVGDLVVRGAAVPERLPAGADNLYFKAAGAGILPLYEALRLDDVGVHISNDTRTTTGNQIISGVGYKASVIIFFACNDEPTLQEFSCGFGTETANMCMYYSESDSEMRLDLINALHVESVDPGRLVGKITDIDANGFTINWSGLPALPSVIFIYLCLP